MRKYRFRRILGRVLIGCAVIGAHEALADGADIFTAECSHCHSLAQDSAPNVGPVLSNIIGKSAGSEPDYEYSDALMSAASAGLVWEAETMDRFLASPKSFLDGNKMAYPGIEDAAIRSSLITWLATSSEEQLAATSRSLTVSDNPDVLRIQALSGDVDYGEYLAGECVTCHAGGSGGVPPVDGLADAYFIQALLEYKSGERSNPVMKLMTESLGDEEIAALAAYFTNHK